MYCRRVLNADVLPVCILALHHLPPGTSIPNHSTMQAAAQSITPEVANQHLVDALQQLEVTVAQALPLQNSPDDQFALDTRITIARDMGYTLVSVCRQLVKHFFGNMLIFHSKNYSLPTVLWQLWCHLDSCPWLSKSLPAKPARQIWFMRRTGPEIGLMIPDSDGIHCISKHCAMRLPMPPVVPMRLLPAQFLPAPMPSILSLLSLLVLPTSLRLPVFNLLQRHLMPAGNPVFLLPLKSVQGGNVQCLGVPA